MVNVCDRIRPYIAKVHVFSLHGCHEFVLSSIILFYTTCSIQRAYLWRKPSQFSSVLRDEWRLFASLDFCPDRCVWVGRRNLQTHDAVRCYYDVIKTCLWRQYINYKGTSYPKSFRPGKGGSLVFLQSGGMVTWIYWQLLAPF